MSLEHRLAEAKRTLDLDSIDRLYANDLFLTGVLGEPSCSKAAVLAEIARGKADMDALTGTELRRTVINEDMKIIAHGDAAVTSYRLVVSFVGQNVDIQRRFRTTNVWMRRADRWEIVAAHTAFLLDPTQASAMWRSAAQPARSRGTTSGTINQQLGVEEPHVLNPEYLCGPPWGVQSE